MAITDKQFNSNQTATFDPYGIRRNKIQGDLETNLLGKAVPGLYESFDAASRLEPQRQAGLKQAIDMFSPQNLHTLADQYAAQQRGMAGDQARQAQSIIGMRGGGIGAQQGAAIAQTNGANKATSDYMAHLMSPEGQQQLQAFIAQLYQSAQTPAQLASIMPFLQEMSQSRQFRQAQQNSQGSILSGLLPIAGSLLGGGAGGAVGSLFAGGSGGGGGSTSGGGSFNAGGYGLSQMFDDYLKNYGNQNYGIGSSGGQIAA